MTGRYGPLTTHKLEGAGGPCNDWDGMIARAVGDEDAILRICEARARTNLAFGVTESVFVPSDIMGAMLTGRRVERADLEPKELPDGWSRVAA